MGITPTPTRPAPTAVAARPPAPAVDDDDRARLLELARTALAEAVGLATRADLEAALEAMDDLTVRAGAFVTLFERGDLRGCMGVLDDLPAPRSVMAAASTAALDDPRFAPLEADELGDIEIEVSLLGPMTELPDPREFVVGEDGIVVELGGRRALLLPQVATEHGLDAEGMLRTVCRKAGLRPDAWSQDAARLLVFRVDRFGGPARVGPARVSPAVARS